MKDYLTFNSNGIETVLPIYFFIFALFELWRMKQGRIPIFRGSVFGQIFLFSIFNLFRHPILAKNKSKMANFSSLQISSFPIPEFLKLLRRVQQNYWGK